MKTFQSKAIEFQKQYYKDFKKGSEIDDNTIRVQFNNISNLESALNKDSYSFNNNLLVDSVKQIENLIFEIK